MDWRERDYYIVEGWYSGYLYKGDCRKIPTLKFHQPYRHFKRDNSYNWNNRLNKNWYLFEEFDGCFKNSYKTGTPHPEVMISCRKEYSFLLELELKQKKEFSRNFKFCKLNKELLGQ